MDPAALSIQLLALVNRCSAEDGEYDPSSEVKRAFVDICGDITTFLQCNPSAVPLRVHPVLMTVVTKSWPAIGQSKEALTLVRLMHIITAALSEHFGLQWIPTCLRLCDVVSSFEEFPQEAKNVLSDRASVDKFCQLRTRYLLEILFSTWDMIKSDLGTCSFDDDLCQVGNMLGRPACLTYLRSEPTVAALAQIDAGLSSADEMATTWAQIIKAVVPATPAVTAQQGKVALSDALSAFTRRATVSLVEDSLTSDQSTVPSSTSTPAPVTTVVLADARPSQTMSVWDLLTYTAPLAAGDPLYGDSLAEDIGLIMSTQFLTALVTHVEYKLKALSAASWTENKATWKRITVDVSEKVSSLVITGDFPMPPGFKMIYSGAVTNVKGPDKSSYHLGDIFNVPFYAHGYQSLTHEAFAPAWCVRKCMKKEVATLVVQKVAINVYFRGGDIVEVDEGRLADEPHPDNKLKRCPSTHMDVLDFPRSAFVYDIFRLVSFQYIMIQVVVKSVRHQAASNLR